MKAIKVDLCEICTVPDGPLMPIIGHARCDVCTILVGPLHLEKQLYKVGSQELCESCYRDLRKRGIV